MTITLAPKKDCCCNMFSVHLLIMTYDLLHLIAALYYNLKCCYTIIVVNTTQQNIFFFNRNTTCT